MRQTNTKAQSGVISGGRPSYFRFAALRPVYRKRAKRRYSFAFAKAKPKLKTAAADGIAAQRSKIGSERFFKIYGRRGGKAAYP